VRRTNTLKAAGALAAGLALLAPIGATHAGWRDSAALGADNAPATIHVGHLFLDSSVRWFMDDEPVDAEAVNARGEINTNIRAGQTLRGVRTVGAALLGDDLTASFTVQCSDLPTLSLDLNNKTQGSEKRARLAISIDGEDICWVEGGETPRSFPAHVIPPLSESQSFEIAIELAIPAGVILPAITGDTVGVGEQYRINLGNMSVVLKQITPDAEPVAPIDTGN